MKRYRIHKFICILILLPQFIYSQMQYSSYEGTHFFVGFMQNEITIDPRYGGLHLKLFIFPSSTTDITIIFPNDSVVNYTNITPSKSLEVGVPINFENFESEVVRKKAIEILSTNPILVYGFSSQYLTSDAFTAIPVEKWGKEYVIISIPNDQYSAPTDVVLDPIDSLYRKTPRQSEFLIISAFDSTEVTFYPRSITEKGIQVGYPKSVILNKGQTYLVKSYPFQKGYGDLSGTVVRGNKPFGVVSGHVRTAIPQGLVPKWDSKNHLCEMLMPTTSWGREFVTVPFSVSPYGDLIKITSYFPNTTVTSFSASGTQTYVLSGSYDVLEIPYVDEPRKWVSDKPIQMAQFLMHSGTDWDSPNYDPAMTLVPPIEQFVQNLTFQTPANISWNPAQFVAHFVNIIGTIDALNETYINSEKIINLSNDIYIFKLFNDAYFWANIKIPYGRYQIVANKGKIAGVVYGVGLADAYALVLGASLINPYIRDSIPPQLTYTDDCGRLQGYFYEPIQSPNTGINYIYVVSDSTFNFTYLLGELKDTSTYAYFTANVVDPYRKGKIVIEVRDRNGNSKKLSYTYEPPSISVPNEVVFSNVKPYDTLRKSILIRNNSFKINILDVYFANKDTRLNWYVRRKIPFEIANADTFSIVVTLTPNGYIKELIDTLTIKVDCNLTYKIPIKVNFLEWKFQTIGYDFGKVYLSDTAYGKVGIVNESDIIIAFDSIAIGTYPNVFKLLKKPKFSLKPGDTAFFDVMFTPNERKDYSSYVIFYDELKVNTRAEIIGRGIAPLVESVLIDFGKVRVNKTKDTVIYLINHGNTDAILNFNRLENFSTDFSANFEFFQNVKFKDTIPVEISFTPKIVGTKSQKAYFTLDWKLHPEIIIEMKGEGILPNVETFDVQFDTIFVFESATKQFEIALSNGTTDLYIKEIIPFSGDINSYEIDFTDLKDLVLSPGSSLSIPITFEPKFVGEHQMTLLLVSDATPSDTLLLSYINVTGFAKRRDTLDANLIVSKNIPDYLCNLVKVDFSVENTGNVEFPIIGTKFEFENFICKNVDTSITGSIVIPGDKIIGSLTGFSTSTQNAKVRMYIYYGYRGDSLLFKEIEFNLNKIRQIFELEFPTAKLKVGEKSSLKVKGRFLNSTQVPFELNLIISAGRKEQIQFLSVPLEIEFRSKMQSWKLPALGSFKNNMVEVICENVVASEDNTQWEFELPFQLFLTSELFVDFSGYVAENSCFLKDESSLRVPIEPFCIYPLRDIELIDEAELISYYPNPIEDYLILEFESQKKDFAFIQIFDNLGNTITEKMKIDIDIGKNREKINFYNFENGIYFVKLHFKNRTKLIMVLKVK